DILPCHEHFDMPGIYALCIIAEQGDLPDISCTFEDLIDNLVYTEKVVDKALQRRKKTVMDIGTVYDFMILLLAQEIPCGGQLVQFPAYSIGGFVEFVCNTS